MKLSNWILLSIASILTQSEAHGQHHDQVPESQQPYLQGVQEEPTLEQLWGEDWPFSGINTFAHLPHTKCLVDPGVEFDIGIVGMPFDTATTYRSGARFGPRALRAASQRQTSLRGYNFRADINPYDNWAKVIDCGDIPITPMDNNLALKQMTLGYENLLNHSTVSEQGEKFPRLIMLGGDHSIILPGLRNLYKKYGEISVIHFDAHLDTWSPSKYPSFWHSDQSKFTHGSMLWMAYKEGILKKKSNVHVGLRSRLTNHGDYEDDDAQGFHRIHADDIMTEGLDKIAQQIIERVPKNGPVYISVDIDVIDPGLAPGTGTPEIGGFLTRELIYLIRKLEDLNVVGADLVEVSPGFDHAEVTALAGSQIVYELITNMVKKGPLNFTDKNVDMTRDSKVLQRIEEIGQGLVNQVGEIVH